MENKGEGKGDEEKLEGWKLKMIDQLDTSTG